ncbi:MAG: TerB family tellurite resistance protein, partial [Synechococcaceae cyanobacterium]|nr:TerB family tellurite resistance protein [Synechococcaceae cyanobacterium]
MGRPTDLTELEHRALERQRQRGEGVGAGDPLGDLLEALRRQSPRLDDNGRELILESAFRVACADGEIEPEERELLSSIATALDISECVLELEITRFQRRLALKAA